MRLRSAETVIAVLERRGELWHHHTGLVGLRGAPLRLLHQIDYLIARTTRAMARGIEWQVPPALGFGTLARADYFASFPQWLTAVSHLSDDAVRLEQVAHAPDAGAAAADAVEPAQHALTPALCYHTYAALEGRTVTRPLRMTTQGTCWRHEGCRHAPLERGWAFTMREVVEIADDRQVERFRRQGIRVGTALADALGLSCEIVQATDPFFAPTARGKALLQNVKALKHELLLPIGDRSIAAASFNHHETFFGNAFRISLPGDRPASSGCIAFGLERWLLAFMVEHGSNAHMWPAIPRRLEPRVES